VLEAHTPGYRLQMAVGYLFQLTKIAVVDGVATSIGIQSINMVLTKVGKEDEDMVEIDPYI
jgi:hypothetical protein